MTPKTHILVAAVALLGSAACVDDRLSVQINDAMAGAIDGKCVLKKSEMQLGAGAVDLGWTKTYLAALRVTSHLSSQDMTSNGQPVSSGARNDFYINEISFTYTGTGVNIPAQVVPSAGTVPAGGELDVGLDLLTNDAATRLSALTIPPGGLWVTVGITLRGLFAHGSKFETGSFSFPLLVNKSKNYGDQLTCTAPLQVVYPGEPPCLNYGQDGDIPYCGCTDCGGACATGTSCNLTTCTCQ